MTRKRTLVGVIGLGLFLTLGLIWVSNASVAAPDNAVARVHFINVGKGDASLVEFPCGAILVDAGGGEGSAPQLVGYLNKFFAGRPDLNRTLGAVVLTHGHLDHTRNIQAVQSAFTVNTLVTNGHFKKKGYRILPANPKSTLTVVDTAQIKRNGLWDPLTDPYDCDGRQQGMFPDIRMIWGDARPNRYNWAPKAYRDENNHSVSLMVTWGGTKALFTGDLERDGLKALLKNQSALLRDVDLYQISHHGFRSGTAAGFLEHINPKVAVISRPADRAWHYDTMQRFQRVVQGTRKPISVPVWKFVDELDASDDESFAVNPNSKVRDRIRPESRTEMSSAIFWTGIDGTIVVEMTSNGLGEISH